MSRERADSDLNHAYRWCIVGAIIVLNLMPMTCRIITGAIEAPFPSTAHQ